MKQDMRDFQFTFEVADHETGDKCAKSCTGHPFFGLHMGQDHEHCLCGDVPPWASSAVSDSECDQQEECKEQDCKMKIQLFGITGK